MNVEQGVFKSNTRKKGEEKMKKGILSVHQLKVISDMDNWISNHREETVYSYFLIEKANPVVKLFSLTMLANKMLHPVEQIAYAIDVMAERSHNNDDMVAYKYLSDFSHDLSQDCLCVLDTLVKTFYTVLMSWYRHHLTTPQYRIRTIPAPAKSLIYHDAFNVIMDCYDEKDQLNFLYAQNPKLDKAKEYYALVALCNYFVNKSTQLFSLTTTLKKLPNKSALLYDNKEQSLFCNNTLYQYIKNTVTTLNCFLDEAILTIDQIANDLSVKNDIFLMKDGLNNSFYLDKQAPHELKTTISFFIQKALLKKIIHDDNKTKFLKEEEEEEGE